MADEPTSTTSEVSNNQPPQPVQEEKKENVTVSDAPAKSETAAVTEEKPAEIKEETKSAQNESSTSASNDAEKTEVADTDASVSAVAKTAPETVEESNVAVPATPATGKKSNGTASAKKKSAGVPEHKSKKLNKKKSKAEFHLDCEPGQLFLARMKGHAPWPSIICDEEILPASLLNSRPVTAAQPDGTFKRPDYAPGGKRQGERTYPVMFLYTNEFAWLPNTDLTPITPEECKSVEEKGKAKSLIAAYGVAAEGNDLQHFKTMLAEHQAAVQEDLDRQAEREAEKEAAKAAKAEKKTRRKSAPAAEEDNEDAMEVDEEGGSQKPKSKKRKKAADAEDEAEEKPAKTPKLKLNGPKTPATDKKAPAKPKSSGKKAPAKKDSDEEMEDAPAAEATPLTAAEIKEKKEKEIRYYRHKLQRGLLSRDDAPSEEEVSHASGYLAKLETYEGLEGDIIRSTKIHKVLRAMLRLSSIPKEEDFNLKKRSNELLQKWNSILGSDGDAEGHTESNSKATTEAPANAEADKKSQSTEKKAEPAVNASAEAKSDTKDDSKTATAAESKVNGTSEKPSEESKNDVPNASESATAEEAKAPSSENTNGVEKTTQPIAASTEAPKSEEKPADSATKPVEATS